MAANRIQLQAALIKSYDRILFAKDVLSPVFGSAFSAGSSLVPALEQPNKSEQEVISTVSIYGNIKLEDNKEVTCYEIVLQPKVRIEQSKVAIQHYVRKLLTAGQAALVNFVPSRSLQEKDRARSIWRLTLVAKDSAITDTGVKEKLTHPKRYTYLLGPGETCKTAAERFETLSTEKEISFQALVNAFSVEKLSEAFFDEYTLHYENFIEHLSKTAFKKSVFKGDDKAIRDFAKKLLGRIVFLYFVQKKGWMGASDTSYKDGMGDFMKSLFTSSGGDDGFYNNWLSLLFFETLNKERANDDFKMPNGKKVKVPFLNGGLFDREDHDEHVLTFKSRLFHNPDFEDAILTEKNKANSRGFLDFLNAFNFTVHEDSPDDSTVAVDPEMLGHIFEHLLERPKEKGTFYTPKEIVHYMCQESLTEYLTTHLSKQYTVYRELGNAQVELFGNETRQGQLKMMEQLGDKALNRDHVEHIVKHKDISQLTNEQLRQIDQLLDSVKICDPAIGSGAFPMGLLQEIYLIKEVVAYELKVVWRPAEVKENIIQNSIYGVDLEKGAVDIARLRFWLSLVVDEEKPRALPNLDYKIMQGNSLLESYEDIDLCVKVSEEKELFRDQNKFSTEDITELKKQVSKYFTAGNSKLKKELQSNIEGLVNKFISERVKDKIERNTKLTTETKEQLIIASRQKPKTVSDTKKKDEALKKLNAQIERHLAEAKRLSEIEKELIQIQKTRINSYFLWHLWFSDIFENGGFDIVIGNPPYVKEDANREAFKGQKSKACYQGKMDLWYLFADLGLTILKNESHLCFIATNNWVTSAGASNFRNIIIDNSQIVNLTDFGPYMIFENASIQTMIMLFKKSNTIDNYTFDYRRLQGNDLSIESIYSLFNKRENNNSIFLNPVVNKEQLRNKKFTFNSTSDSELLNVMQSKHNFFIRDEEDKKLGIKTEFGNGIDVMQDFVSKASAEKLVGIAKVGDGVFVLSQGEYESYNFSTDEKNILKPYFTTKQLTKYYGNPNNTHWVIYTKSDISKINKKTNKAEIDSYPRIKKHLDKFKPIITSAFAPYGLHRAREQYLFEGVKIFAQRKCPTEPIFTYTNFDCFVSRAFLIIQSDRIDLKYLTGLLNSKLIAFWLRRKGKMQGNAYQLDKEPLLEIPIYRPTGEEAIKMTLISTLVDYIIYLKSQQSSDVNIQLIPSYFEQLIDGLIYELYFPEILKQNNREVSLHIGELPAITSSMSSERKMSLIKTVFNRLNEKDHPVRLNLFYMNSIPEIATIEGKHASN